MTRSTSQECQPSYGVLSTYTSSYGEAPLHAPRGITQDIMLRLEIGTSSEKFYNNDSSKIYTSKKGSRIPQGSRKCIRCNNTSRFRTSLPMICRDNGGRQGIRHPARITRWSMISNSNIQVVTGYRLRIRSTVGKSKIGELDSRSGTCAR